MVITATEHKSEVNDVEDILTDLVGRRHEKDLTDEELQARAATANYGYTVLSWDMETSFQEFKDEITTYFRAYLDALKSDRGLR
jgi:hypothetical protein